MRAVDESARYICRENFGSEIDIGPRFIDIDFGPRVLDFEPMSMILKRLHMSMNACFIVLPCEVPLRSFMILLPLNAHDSYVHFLPVILTGPYGSYLLASIQVKVSLRKWVSQVKLELWGRSVYRVFSIERSVGGVL